MTSIMPRPQLFSGPSTSSHRAPRKSSSFLSLRREKDRPAASLESPHNPSAPSSSYFDAYPKPRQSSTRSAKQTSHSRQDSFASNTKDDYQPRSQRRIVKERSSTEPMYSFPSVERDVDDMGGLFDIPAFSRQRSTTGPSGKSQHHWAESNPTLRFSGSSQQSETPPDTPLDIYPSTFGFPVHVSAPVSGVETMDALVDGMNGGDDLMASSITRRNRFGIPGHHPLYQPPLPTPPPGVVLGGGKGRPSKKPSRTRTSFSEDEDNLDPPLPKPQPRKKTRKPSASRGASSLTVTTPKLQPSPDPSSCDERWSSKTSLDAPSLSISTTPRAARSRTPSTPYTRPPSPTVDPPVKSVAPSISEIIRAYAPAQVRTVSTRAPSSHGHSIVGHQLEPSLVESESEMISRSSIDSLADEIQQTLKVQSNVRPAPPPPPSSFMTRRHSTFSDTMSMSPRSDSASYHTPSIYSQPRPASPIEVLAPTQKLTPSQEVAKYLRSARLTTLLKLTRSPHASSDNPLTISLSDLGSPTGYPLVVFLGLGCVRHIMGLYDEMAECMNLRLITIDRWGLGRTEPRSKSAKGIVQWAGVVEEVLDLLQIRECSVMAHSAGAPYALSFANKLKSRIRGDICLLAPWVGGSESGGYRWLKYVPNGILKTAQAAEWKLQAWMIGKPPTITYAGIGYTATKPPAGVTSPQTGATVYFSNSPNGRPSMGSFSSDYDDLRDFDGRFESKSTLGMTRQPSKTQDPAVKRKISRRFINPFKSNTTPPVPSSTDEKLSGKKLKALRSMGSLKGRSPSLKKPDYSSPKSPSSFKLEGEFGLQDFPWSQSMGSLDSSSSITGDSKYSTNGHTLPRSSGRRSISFTSTRPPLSLPSSPAPSTITTQFSSNARGEEDHSYQAILGNALIAASHAESANGTHNDLLQILNHDNHPWGFSYTSYPHDVRIWYGDKDEKIAENAVRWMEKVMGEDKCSVTVVKGAEHALMYKSQVVVEVLEHVLSYWESSLSH